MSFQLKGSDATINIRWIPKYTCLERVLHWVHTAMFLPLALTGYILFAPWLQALAQGDAGQPVRVIHVDAHGDPFPLFAVLRKHHLHQLVDEITTAVESVAQRLVVEDVWVGLQNCVSRSGFVGGHLVVPAIRPHRNLALAHSGALPGHRSATNRPAD